MSYSDDNTGGGGSSFNILNMQASFDDSSSHLDLPSLLQANGNNGGRDVRLGVGLDHHQHHYNHQYQQHHHHQQQHHHQHSSWSAHAVDPLPPVALLPENKPQELPSPDGSPEVSGPPPQHSSTTSAAAAKKRAAGDMSALGGVGHHQAAPSLQHFTSAGDEAPKPARAKKKKVEKNSNALPLDDNDLLDDEFGDGLDCEVDGGGGGGGGGKDVKRQMRLVKNRQAAQQFRKRQKLYIQDLERRCTTLTAQNASYAAKVELLSTENRLVKEQLEYLRSFVSQAVQVSLTPAAVAGGPLQMPGPLSAALAGAIPAPLLGIGSPLAGALSAGSSSHHPSQTGPGRPAFAPLQPHPITTGGSHLGAKMPSFPSPVSLAPASSSAPRGGGSAYGGASASSSHLSSLQPASSASAYARGGSSSLMPDLHHHRPL